MKTKLFLLILLFVIPFGCKKDKKIEIIQADQVYFPSNELDVLPEIIVKDKEGKAILELTKRVKKLYDSLNEKDKESFKVDYRLLVNENGSVDKIQIVQSKYPQFDKIMIETAETIKFTPAIKEGKKVKSSFPWGYEHSILSNLNLNLIPPNQYSNEGIYFVAVDEMPMPIGGLQSIQEKILYPEIAKRAGIEGRVFIQAFIDETGNVADAKVIKGVGHGLDEAALEAVKQTKFTPGIHKGEPVKVQVSIPIVFKLDSQITIHKILSNLTWGSNPSQVKDILIKEFPFNSYEEVIQVNESTSKSKTYEYSGGSLYGVPTSNWSFVFNDSLLEFIAIRIKTNSQGEKTGKYTTLKNEIEKLAREKNSDRLNEWVLSDAKRTIVRLQILPKDNLYDILMILSSGKLIDKKMFN